MAPAATTITATTTTTTSSHTITRTTAGIPKWAKVYKNKEDLRKTKEPSTANSEELLRLKSVRYWSRSLRQAQNQAWKHVCNPALIKFFDFKTNAEADASATASSDHKKYSILPSNVYPQELLPCLVVSPPPSCKLDRQVMMQSIYHTITAASEKKPRRAMTILLPKLLPTLRQTLALIWRQILNQEPNNILKQHAKKKLARNKRTQSLQQWILWWASQTEHFDELVILLEVRFFGFTDVMFYSFANSHSIHLSLLLLILGSWWICTNSSETRILSILGRMEK